LPRQSGHARAFMVFISFTGAFLVFIDVFMVFIDVFMVSIATIKNDCGADVQIFTATA
jgi:hypothetical protein